MLYHALTVVRYSCCLYFFDITHNIAMYIWGYLGGYFCMVEQYIEWKHRAEEHTYLQFGWVLPFALFKCWIDLHSIMLANTGYN